MATVTIRNKATGETKTVPVEQLTQYGLGSASPISASATTPAPAGTVSDTPSTIGMVAGSIAGSPLGPLGRMGGAGIGAGIGQEVAQAQAGQPGDPGAFLQALGPLGMIARFAQKGFQGPNAQKSNTEKAMTKGVVSQAGGEAVATAFAKLLNPKIVSGVLNDLTSIISKKTSGPPIPAEQLQTALREKLMEVASSFAGNQEAIQSGIRPLARTIGQVPGDSAVGGEILNILRKRLNMDIGQYSDLTAQEKLFAKAFSSVVKDFQTQAAPLAGPAIGLEKAALEHAPNLLDFFTLGGYSKISPLIGSAVSGLGKAGAGLSKYLLPSLFKSASEER
jgi:hypothetical protein